VRHFVFAPALSPKIAHPSQKNEGARKMTWKNMRVESLQRNSPVSIQAASQGSTDEPAHDAPLLSTHQSLIGKGLVLVGEITGDSLADLTIEGTVQGAINLPGARITVRPSGQVTSNIFAAKVVLRGNVTGSITATDLIEIRFDGRLAGDAQAPRVKIEDGAFVAGNVQVSALPEIAHLASASTEVQQAAISGATTLVAALEGDPADSPKTRLGQSASLIPFPIAGLKPAPGSQAQLPAQ
jgi:cytoskeletal protein CcmA (bactofilin family)